MGLKVVLFDRESHGQPQWNPDDEHGVAIGNPKFAQVIHVANVDEVTGEYKFDGILRAEPGGGIFLPIDSEGRVGLQLRMRPQVKNQEKHRSDWPNFDTENLNRQSWEIPRGFAQVSDKGKAERGADAALREAEEETQSAVVAACQLIDSCDNTASSPHFTANQVGYIDSSKKTSLAADPNEKMLSTLKFFTVAELRELIAQGTLYCDYTLGAIGAWLLLFGGADVKSAAEALAKKLNV